MKVLKSVWPELTVVAGVLVLVICLFVAVAVESQGSNKPTDATRIHEARQDDAIRDLRRFARRTCAIKQWEDLSGGWEHNDDERDLCDEYVSQIGR